MPILTIQRPANGPRYRVAIVGAGYIADFHLPLAAAQANVEVVAVCDSDASRRITTARRFGVAHAVGSLAELKPLGIDIVHLLVPPDLHVKLARECFELGFGVFLEKPVALSGDDARLLARLAAERGVVLGGNHNNLHHPAFARLLERVRAGEIGRVEHVQVTLSVPLAQLDANDFAHWMFREPRNIVFEQAVHPLCQVHALIGRVQRASTAILSSRELLPGQVFHERWSVAGVGERGTMQLHLGFGQGFTRSTIQVLGTDGSLEADLFHNALAGETKTQWLEFWNSFLASWRRGGELRRDARAVLSNYLKFTLGIGERQDAFFVGMRASIAGFYAALERGTPLPTDGVQAAEVLDWCDTIAASAPTPPTITRTFPAPCPPRPGEVVVLGATGFIGQRTLARLAESGLPVTIVARRAHALAPEITAGIEAGRIRFFRGTLEDAATLAPALRGAHTLVQLATGNGDTWEKVQRAMVDGTRAVALAALDAGVKRFVYVSSIAALYTGRDAGGVIEDSLALDPEPTKRPLYSRGKMAAEEALVALFRERALPLVIVRPGVVMGAGTALQHSGLGLWTRDNHCVGWGAGDTPLPIVWVDDVADVLARIARHERDDLHGKALNVCARTSLTARECVEELRHATGRRIEFHPRALWISQGMEIGKYLVKQAGRRAGVEFPSWRDIKARALEAPFSSRTAREVLGWKPVEDREGLLDRCIRVYRPR